MRILLDTNIIIHREASSVKEDWIGKLFNWMDRLKYNKCVHPTTLEEIKEHKDPKVVKTMNTKLESYNLLKTKAPITPKIQEVIDKFDQNKNDQNDSLILNEVFSDRVDFLITEDKKIHKKAAYLGISSKVYSITSFIEKVTVENPDLTDYKVLSVKKYHFGELDIADEFFDNFREDYLGFDMWFNKKADEIAYVCLADDNKVLAFLYVKVEGKEENYQDITPVLPPKKRLKIGTFKVVMNGYKLGERFLKIIFDNALLFKVEEIYVTIFPKRKEQMLLIHSLKDWGFYEHGIKKTPTGEEHVFVRDFSKQINVKDPKLVYPFVSAKSNIFMVSIYPDYHTELFPDSILRTESASDFIENQPHRNAISKVFISRSINKNLKPGDLIVFYRTGGTYQGVVSTIGVVENVVLNIKDENDLILHCRKRSVFSDQELRDFWNFNKTKPFVVNFLYVFSLKKRINLKTLIDLGIIKDLGSAPRGFELISKQHFDLIIKESQSDASIIVDQT